MCHAGFVVNEDKSVWEPTQVLHWLGITWNSSLGSLKIAETRIVKIINTIDHIIEADFQVSVRELASFADQIISTGPVVGNIGHCVLSTLCRDNRPFPNSHGWTGSSMKRRLMWANVFKCKLVCPH